MRTTFKPIVSMMTAVMATSFTLAACTTEAEDTGVDGETGIEAPAEGADLTGAEITEAVPGVDAANPEGDTANTAGLDEDSNIEYSDDPNSDRDAETAAD